MRSEPDGIRDARARPYGYCASIPTGHDPQGDARDERLAQNEVIFRSVNEAIEQQAIRSGGLASYEFICECASTGCFARVGLTLAEYERVRSDGTTFLVTPGHEHDEVSSSPAGIRVTGSCRRTGQLGWSPSSPIRATAIPTDAPPRAARGDGEGRT